MRASRVDAKATAKPTRQGRPVSSWVFCPTHARAESEHQMSQVTNLLHFTTLLSAAATPLLLLTLHPLHITLLTTVPRTRLLPLTIEA